MAPLNPDVKPTNDPDFRRYSSPISVPDIIEPKGVAQNQILPKGQEIGDRSAEYLGKAEGTRLQAEGVKMEQYADLFKNITGIGDFIGKGAVAITKKTIEDKVYNVADAERQSYTETLEKIKQSGVSNIVNPGATTEPGEQGDSPQEVQDLGDTLSALRSAKDSGKISSSYYWGRLLEKAKQLRQEYPGFKEEIDAQFSKVTGQNPANAYVRSLTADINRNASSAGSELKKAETFVLQRNGYPNADQTMQKVRSGEWNLTQAMQWAAPYEREDYELKRRAALINDKNMTREMQVKQVGDLFDTAAATAVNRAVDRMSGKMGIASAEDASRIDNAVKAGSNPIPQQMWTQWGQENAQMKLELRLQMKKDADKSGATQILGNKAVNERIDQALKPLDDINDRIYNKDAGGYYRLTQDLKSINDETQKALLTHPKVGPPLRLSQALKEIGGETNLQRFTNEIIKGQFPDDMKTYYKQMRDGIATQLSLKDGKGVMTFNDVIDDMKQKGKTDKKMSSQLMDEVSKIHDLSVPEEIRQNYAKAAFDPSNRRMISKISEGSQNEVFLKWTSKSMTDAMFAQGQKDPQAWKNYTDWASDTFTNEIANKDINGLAEIRNPRIRVAWDSENKRFIPSYSPVRSAAEAEGMRAGVPPRATTGAEDPEYQNVIRMTNRLNSAIGNYKNIAESAGISTEAFVLKAIATANPQAINRSDSIPYQILKDIGMSRMRERGGQR